MILIVTEGGNKILSSSIMQYLFFPACQIRPTQSLSKQVRRTVAQNQINVFSLRNFLCLFLGHLLQMMGDERLKVSGSSGGFPALGHPGFGLHALTSGHPECGSFGGFGFPSLAAHSQFGTFPGGVRWQFIFWALPCCTLSDCPPFGWTITLNKSNYSLFVHYYSWQQQ